METRSLLEIQNLTRRYPSPDGEEPLTVFENANYDIKRGEFVLNCYCWMSLSEHLMR